MLPRDNNQRFHRRQEYRGFTPVVRAFRINGAARHHHPVRSIACNGPGPFEKEIMP